MLENHKETPSNENVETKKCRWCGRTENLVYASKYKPHIYFCSESCFKKFYKYSSKHETRT
mgnify:CR=1 FL=1